MIAKINYPSFSYRHSLLNCNAGLVNFVCIVFEIGDKMLTLSSMENLIVHCNHTVHNEINEMHDLTTGA